MRTGRSAYIRRMNRVEIEIELHRGRAETLEWVTSLSDEELQAPRTQSENDPDSWWSHADHFIHTTLIERNFNEMVRRHLRGEQGMDTALVGEGGKALRPIEDVMAYVHSFTEGWKVEQQGKPLDELVRIGLAGLVQRGRHSVIETLVDLEERPDLASRHEQDRDRDRVAPRAGRDARVGFVAE